MTQSSITFKDQVRLLARVAMIRLRLADGVDVAQNLAQLEEDICMIPSDHIGMPSSTTTAMQVVEQTVQ